VYLQGDSLFQRHGFAFDDRFQQLPRRRRKLFFRKTLIRLPVIYPRHIPHREKLFFQDTFIISDGQGGIASEKNIFMPHLYEIKRQKPLDF